MDAHIFKPTAITRLLKPAEVASLLCVRAALLITSTNW